jgi:hypothetical protein
MRHGAFGGLDPTTGVMQSWLRGARARPQASRNQALTMQEPVLLN